jgi:hypothetical protein
MTDSPPPTAGDAAPPAWAAALDAVDAHTAAADALHSALSAGFFALAREHASGHAASLRLSAALHDHRAAVSASLRAARPRDGAPLQLLDTRRAPEAAAAAVAAAAAAASGDAGREAVDAERSRLDAVPLRHSIHPMPSAALREASECFERAVAAAVDVANAAAVVDERLSALAVQ